MHAARRGGDESERERVRVSGARAGGRQLEASLGGRERRVLSLVECVESASRRRAEPAETTRGLSLS